MSTQSWAAWFLDSYASSVSPATSDSSPLRQHDEPPPFSSGSRTTAGSTSSAYGPYVRTGRGGAGNFTWQADLEAPRSTSPVDQLPIPQSSLSERRQAAAKLEHINTQRAMRLRQSSAHVLPVGRGGAGNYAPAVDINPPKRSPSLPVSLDASLPSRQPSAYAGLPGRGGSGNYAAAAELHARQTRQDEQRRNSAAEQRHEQVVVEVDGLLQPPPGAWLGGRRRSEVMFGDT